MMQLWDQLRLYLSYPFVQYALIVGVLIALDGKLAQTIISTAKADADILCLDSMQSTTKKDVQEGAKYLAIMEKNLDVLAQALR